MARFEGKTVIVTGAASGIGAAIAERFASEGASVVIADLKVEAAATQAARLANAIGIGCDVGDEAAVVACADAAVARFGRIDVIVNNAGLMTFKTLDRWTGDDWLKVLRVDLFGAAFFTRELFRRVGPEGGAIVNISSVHAVETSANAAPYAAAKAGLLSLTRTSAIEGKAKKIRANAILPGAIDTPMLWDNPNVKSGAEVVDKASVGQPRDVAAAAVFLASDEAAFITGASLAVDGGRLAAL
jgi:NAD(P)-dependent dehydrogenase (short-subunit alcohol dehydrogenase family)